MTMTMDDGKRSLGGREEKIGMGGDIAQCPMLAWIDMYCVLKEKQFWTDETHRREEIS